MGQHYAPVILQSPVKGRVHGSFINAIENKAIAMVRIACTIDRHQPHISLVLRRVLQLVRLRIEGVKLCTPSSARSAKLADVMKKTFRMSRTVTKQALGIPGCLVALYAMQPVQGCSCLANLSILNCRVKIIPAAQDWQRGMPASQSWTVSARPPVRRTTGRAP